MEEQKSNFFCFFIRTWWHFTVYIPAYLPKNLRPCRKFGYETYLSKSPLSIKIKPTYILRVNGLENFNLLKEDFIMKKKISVLLMVLVMVLSATVTSYAAVGDEVMPRETSSVTFNIDRTSGTTADVEIITRFSGIADEYSVVVYLQKNVSGTWVNDTTNSDYVFYNNGFNSNVHLFSNIYDSLTYGTSYRLMCVSRDVRNNTEYRTTTYSSPF